MIFSCEIRAGKMCLKVNELEEELKEELQHNQANGHTF